MFQSITSQIKRTCFTTCSQKFTTSPNQMSSVDPVLLMSMLSRESDGLQWPQLIICPRYWTKMLDISRVTSLVRVKRSAVSTGFAWVRGALISIGGDASFYWRTIGIHGVMANADCYPLGFGCLVYLSSVCKVTRCLEAWRRRCCTIMGREEGNLTAAQILYPLMQCTEAWRQTDTAG